MSAEGEKRTALSDFIDSFLNKRTKKIYRDTVAAVVVACPSQPMRILVFDYSDFELAKLG